MKDKQQLPKRRFDRSKKNGRFEENLGKTCKFWGQILVFEKGKCPAWGATCAKCKRRNHFALKCNNKVNSLTEESHGSEESDIEYITSITDRPEVVRAIKKEDYRKEIYTEMVVAKKPVKFQVDSGASVNVIPAELAPDEPLKRTTKTLRMWNDTTLQPLGSCRTILQNPKNGKKFSVEFLVVEKQLTPIIGAWTAQQMGLITVNEENFKIAQPPHRMRSAVKSLNTTEGIVKHYLEVFQRELGTLPGTVHLEVDQNITPVVAPPRRVPTSLKGQLKQELDRLQEIGVITPADESTQLVSGLAVAVKKTGTLRICLHPRQLNTALRREISAACSRGHTSRAVWSTNLFHGRSQVWLLASCPGTGIKCPYNIRHSLWQITLRSVTFWPIRHGTSMLINFAQKVIDLSVVLNRHVIMYHYMF